MKPLETYRRVLTWLCAYSVTEDEAKWKRFAYIAFGLFICIGNVLSLASTAAFIWVYVSTDLEEALYAFLQFFGTLAVNYTFIIGIIMKSKITITINRLSDIYDERKFRRFILIH